MTVKDIARTKVGTPFRSKGLALFPLSLPIERHDGVKLADDTLQVSELASATVPQLQVHNPGAVDMLIPAGKILEGGRQTRTVNVSILVPAGATMEIPVSCVEAGRWGGGPMFRDSNRYASRRVRIAKERGVKRNIDSFGMKTSDQGAVWNSISAEMNVRNLTHDSSLFLRIDEHIEEDESLHGILQEAMSQGIQPDQTGLAIAVGGKVIGIELFTSVDDLRASWEALVRTAVLDHDVAAVDASEATIEDVEKFLTRVAELETTISKGTGLGTEYHIAEPDLVAHALDDDQGNLMHAYAFAEA